MNYVKQLVKKEPFLVSLLLVLVFLSILFPFEIPRYFYYVKWRTILALTGLLVITTGLKESGCFSFFARKLLLYIKNERSLAVFWVLFAALLSAFVTNDIALFIVVPLTLEVQRVIENDVSKLIVFEVIGVNVGSSLTPIGNPQNLFLWHESSVSFIVFSWKMLPLVVVLLSILVFFVWIVFHDNELTMSVEDDPIETKNKSLFYSSTFLLLIFLFLMDSRLEYLFLPLVFLFYLVFYREVLFKTDWLLLITFIVIFIDFDVISRIPFVMALMNSFDMASPGTVFLISVLVSQLISNVPASVFVSKFSNDWLAIAYGVDVAGNGLFIGSMANIIALRLINTKKAWKDFHIYSVIYLLITAVTTYFLFFVLFPISPV